jgi:hypothetical protein
MMKAPSASSNVTLEGCLALAVGAADEDALDELLVLHGQRLVEAEPVPVRLDDLRAAGLAARQPGRIRRQRVEDEEHDHGERDQRQHHGDQPPNQEPSHLEPSPRHQPAGRARAAR